MMVFGPGGYRFTDFVRVGVPLNLLMWIVAVILIPLDLAVLAPPAPDSELPSRAPAGDEASERGPDVRGEGKPIPLVRSMPCW